MFRGAEVLEVAQCPCVGVTMIDKYCIYAVCTEAWLVYARRDVGTIIVQLAIATTHLRDLSNDSHATTAKAAQVDTSGAGIGWVMVDLLLPGLGSGRIILRGLCSARHGLKQQLHFT
nr:hypothetical protein CFP56_11718 [Quercus suber]